MSVLLSEYLSEGSQMIFDLFSSKGVTDEEKRTIADTLSDELINHIGDIDNLEDCGPLLYGADIQFIDNWISKVLADQHTSYSDCEDAIINCDRQQQLLTLCQNRKWSIPRITNTDPEKCKAQVQKRQEAIGLVEKIVDEDRQIGHLINEAQTDLNVDTCDKLLGLLSSIEDDIALCESKKIALPPIDNKDIKKCKKRAAELKCKAEDKELLYNKIIDIDQCIYDIDLNKGTDASQWKTIQNLYQQEEKLISDCLKRGYPLPSLKCDASSGIKEKYEFYCEIVSLDRSLAAERSSLSTNKQYNEFFEKCEILSRDIEICNKSGWGIPKIQYTDPMGLAAIVRDEKKSRDKAKNRRKTLVAACVYIIIILSGILFGVYKYWQHNKHVPFSSADIVGKTKEDVWNEFDNVGFKNIVPKQDESGWYDSGEVLSVTIDGTSDYVAGDIRKTDAEVEITYASDGRIDITDLLQDWNTTNYTVIQKKLNNAGFTDNITLVSTTTYDREQDGITTALKINGLDYTDERCCIPPSAPIVITYYSLLLKIGNTNSDFIGQFYGPVEKALNEQGYTNVKPKETADGWFQSNKIVRVSIDGSTSYSREAAFDPKVPIIITYSSVNRINVSACVKDWDKKNYGLVKTAFENNGFVVTAEECITDDPQKNNCVASLKFGGSNDEFTGYDCYLKKGTPVRLEYYRLKIKIGRDATAFVGRNYKEVESELKSKGFDNVKLIRTNKLSSLEKKKAGSIMSVRVDGSTNYLASDAFDYHTRIDILVNTSKEGYEDIIIIKEDN